MGQRVQAWGEVMVFLIALPALLSPLILLPLPPDTSPTLVSILKILLPICEHPLVWAFVASAVAVWVARSRMKVWRKAIVVGIAAIAWVPAIYTASTISALARF